MKKGPTSFLLLALVQNTFWGTSTQSFMKTNEMQLPHVIWAQLSLLFSLVSAVSGFNQKHFDKDSEQSSYNCEPAICEQAGLSARTGMRMRPHVMHEEVELGLGKLIDLSSLLLGLSTVLDGCLNSSDEKERQSYREQCGLRGSIQCGLRVGASTDEQAERPATE